MYVEKPSHTKGYFGKGLIGGKLTMTMMLNGQGPIQGEDFWRYRPYSGKTNGVGSIQGEHF